MSSSVQGPHVKSASTASSGADGGSNSDGERASASNAGSTVQGSNVNFTSTAHSGCLYSEYILDH